LVTCFHNSSGLVEKALFLLTTPGLKEQFRIKRDKMLEENIDVTSLLIWFVENYPQSKAILKSDPSFLQTFN
jgi:hypothetical protein